MIFKEYDPSELRKLQLASVTILKELDRVCKALDIPYFLYAGTAIGALRHKGFIPWDDDIDIGFFRDDYERLLAEAPAILGDDFELNNGRTNPYFPACNSNLSLKGTLCVPEEFDSCPFQYPIGIGLFAFDKISDNQKIRKKQLRGTWLWARLSFLVATSTPHTAFGGIKRKLVLFACKLANGFLAVARISPTMIHEKWEKAALLAKDEDVDLFVDFTDQNPLNWRITKEEVFPLRSVQFEDMIAPLPNQYDQILRRGYGDYMELPPVEDRKNHYPSKLEFGKFE